MKRLALVSLGAILLGPVAARVGADDTTPPASMGQDHGMGMGMMGNPEKMAEMRLKHLTGKLSLTADQQTQVKKLIEDEQTQIKPLHEQMKSIHEQFEGKLKGVLTDDQKKKYDEMKEHRKEMRKDMIEKRMEHRAEKSK
jgi:Spy/CpxP family protein refolding chaperone